MPNDSLPKTIATAATWAATRFGERTAIGGSNSISFSALEAEANRAAGAFFAAGIVKGDRIAIWAPNRWEWISACLGAQGAGAVIVPLNTRLKGLEAQHILNKSRARILIASASLWGMSTTELLKGIQLPYLERIITFESDWREFLSNATGQAISRAREIASSINENDPSDILFTSGTTGEPKGVVSSHGQSIRTFALWSQCVGLHKNDRYLIVNPFFHVFGYKAGWLASLITGATSYPQPILDIRQICRTIATEKITVLPGPPTLFQLFLASKEAQLFDLSSLRLAITGAATIPPILITRMKKELGIANVLTGYGLTEASVVSISNPGDSAERIATTAGKPIPGIQVCCVRANGEPAKDGQQGEIRVKGFNVMQGYFEDSSSTAQAIDHDGWLHTGDVGYFDEAGYLKITDRLKDMYISGGFNCYPAEVERLLCQHPSVAQAAVIGIPDPQLGEVGKAFVILRPNENISSEKLLHWSRENMANYKAPRQLVIVETLPTNAAGKVQKFLLRPDNTE